ncbi:MAG: DUF2829 domain-containing protein [Cytophagales bacterium]|nr:DUF2829 domain-containing protein [Cytophagales bacterium]
MQKVNFGEAIEALKAGKKVKRSEWDDFLVIGEPKDYPFPVIFIKIAYSGTRDYFASSDDLLAEDWVILGG